MVTDLADDLAYDPGFLDLILDHFGFQVEILLFPFGCGRFRVEYLPLFCNLLCLTLNPFLNLLELKFKIFLPFPEIAMNFKAARVMQA